MILVIILVCAGVIFWLANLNIYIFSRDWPLIIVLLGFINLYLLLKRNRKANIIKDLEKGKISPQEAEDRLHRLR